MSEAEILENLFELNNLLVGWLSLAITLFFGYLVGLAYMVSTWGRIMRALSFIVFSMGAGFIALLGRNVGTMFDGLTTELQRLLAEGTLSEGGQIILRTTTDQRWEVTALFWAIYVLLWLAFGYLTLFHRWTTTDRGARLAARSRAET